MLYINPWKKSALPPLRISESEKTLRFLQALQWTNAEHHLNTQKSHVREQQLQKQEKCFSCLYITLHCGWPQAILHTNTFILTKDSRTKAPKVPRLLKIKMLLSKAQTVKEMSRCSHSSSSKILETETSWTQTINVTWDKIKCVPPVTEITSLYHTTDHSNYPMQPTRPNLYHCL